MLGAFHLSALVAIKIPLREVSRLQELKVRVHNGVTVSIRGYLSFGGLDGVHFLVELHSHLVVVFDLLDELEHAIPLVLESTWTKREILDVDLFIIALSPAPFLLLFLTTNSLGLACADIAVEPSDQSHELHPLSLSHHRDVEELLVKEHLLSLRVNLPLNDDL